MSKWYRSIDDIRIVCKRCNREMVLDSSRNDKMGLFSCPWCESYINMEVK